MTGVPLMLLAWCFRWIFHWIRLWAFCRRRPGLGTCFFVPLMPQQQASNQSKSKVSWKGCSRLSNSKCSRTAGWGQVMAAGIQLPASDRRGNIVNRIDRWYNQFKLLTVEDQMHSLAEANASDRMRIGKKEEGGRRGHPDFSFIRIPVFVKLRVLLGGRLRRICHVPFAATRTD